MFGKQVSALTGNSAFTPDQIQVLQQLIGNCQQPLEHSGQVTINPTRSANATDGALNVYAYRQDGGLNAYGMALNIKGTIKYNGSTFAPLFIGAIVPFSGTATELAVWTSNGWATCDGTLGTPDLRDKFIVCKGSTYTSTGGSATHDHGAATGSGGTGNTGSSTTGITATAAASGNTGSAVTSITVDNHNANTTGAASGNTSTATTGITATDSGHTHVITHGNSTFDTGANPGVASVTSPTASGTANISVNDSGHFHTLNSHTHTTPQLTHTVNDLGHVHTLGSHTHTISDSGHTHTGPSHTHSIASASNIPPYYALTFLRFVGF